MRIALAARGLGARRGAVTEGGLNIRGVVVSFREAAGKYAAIADASGLEDCRQRALALLDDVEARLDLDHRERLQQELAAARSEIVRRPAV